jgi:rare lipoprotein A
MFKMRAKMISVGLLGAAVILTIDLAKADQLGHASWYSMPTNRTANGEQMNPNELTAAHRSLPFGTRVLVENLSNGSSVVVRINDRGPFIGGRIIDLSKAAATSIGMINAGTAKVRVTTVEGSALAALGETTAKAKDGASKAVMAKVDMTPAETPKLRTAANKSVATRRVASKLSARSKRFAGRYHSRDKVRVASLSKHAKYGGERVRVARHANGIRAVASEASRLSSRRVMVAFNPYAIHGVATGSIKPARWRRAG